MDKEIFIAIITSVSTIASAFGAAYLTNYLNDKKQKDNEEDILINDIKNFAQQSFNIANENKGLISQHEFIRLTRALKEYQSYFRVLNIDEDDVSTSKSLKLISKNLELNEFEIMKLSVGFNDILRELAKINK